MVVKREVPVEEETDAKRVKLADASSDDEFNDLDDSIPAVMTATTKYTDKATYLETINRKALNFDMPLVCSASVAATNIHICLICNKYLQGASARSPAYMHAIATGHHVFINAQTGRFIILPEQLILSDKREKELHDIKLLLNPILDMETIKRLDTTPISSKLLNKESYEPGYIPLINDIIFSDGSREVEIARDLQMVMHNTIYYAFTHLSSVRDKLLLHTNSESTPLFNHLSLLTRKIWSPFLFKKLTSSYAIENYLVEHKVPEVIMNDSRLFYNWLINEMIQEETSLKGDFIGKLKLNGLKKANKFSLIPIKLPQQSVFKDSLSISIEQYQLEKLLEMKKLKVLNFPTYLTIYIDRKNDLSVDGLENKLNMNIVKYDPDMLLIDGKKYSLVASVTYDNKTQVYDKARDIWREFDGKSVREVEKALLFISNCKFLFWEKRELN